MTYHERIQTKRYLVCGKRAYRNHQPGAMFEARLDPEAEARALARGNIKVLEVVDLSLKNGDYELPKDWPRPAANDSQEENGEVVLASKTKEGSR